MSNNIELLLKFFYEKISLLDYIWQFDSNDILNNSNSIKLYPFENSFDEVRLNILEWIDKSIEEITKQKSDIDFTEFYVNHDNYKNELIRSLTSFKVAFEEISFHENILKDLDSYQFYPFSIELKNLSQNVSLWVEKNIEELI